MESKSGEYLLAGQPTELERLQLQSRVWEPAGRDLLARIPAMPGCRAVEVGCGVMGWLRILSDWVGVNGVVVGSDVDDKMLAMAERFVDSERLFNVSLVKDDLFATTLAPHSFDLLHARFQIAPLGRAEEQVDAYVRLLKPGGVLVVEDPEMGSWRVNPGGPAVQRLIALIEQGFLAGGGNFNAGRELPSLLRKRGLEPTVRAQALALAPGHPYLRLPLQFAAALRPRLETLVPKAELSELLATVEVELARPGTWGTTFTLIQAYATVT